MRSYFTVLHQIGRFPNFPKIDFGAFFWEKIFQKDPPRHEEAPVYTTPNPMSSTHISSTAQRLASLRTRLLAFDYGEAVGPESIDLVERLFGDLVSTTEVRWKNFFMHKTRMASDLFRHKH